MNVFQLRENLVGEYAQYVQSFINIRDPRVREEVEQHMGRGELWPDPLIQLNPSFQHGASVDALVDQGILHEDCRKVFRRDKDQVPGGRTLRLHHHQEEAIRIAREGHNYVLTTGTGSGKSLTYIIPIVDHVLRNGSRRGIQAVVIYPMNALANSQLNELHKFINIGFPNEKGPVTFARYTGQESDEEKQQIIANPPDILLTNYVMLELILTRPREKQLIRSGHGLRFLVLDELHTYRGRQGADVAMLVRRVRESFQAPEMQCVGTSATLAGPGTYLEQQSEVARVAGQLFGAEVQPEHVIGETLRRATPELDFADTTVLAALRRRLSTQDGEPPSSFAEFIEDPLSCWIETEMGLHTDRDSGRLMRAEPLSITGPDGAARRLAELTDEEQVACREAIEHQLLASYTSEPNPETGFPAFAFRLHQFISRGDTVYATLEGESERYVTLQAQQYVPGDRTRSLFPLAFCRECGQAYYLVRLVDDQEGRRIEPRDFADTADTEETHSGYLYTSAEEPWPTNAEAAMDRLPEDWLEMRRDGTAVRRTYRERVPVLIRLDGSGNIHPDGAEFAYFPTPLRFCLRCGVTYNPWQRSDFGKLASLATEGRSTATTVLSLSAVRHLKKEGSLEAHARKLLSFSDNRQDASLQAGHFNDFVEVAVLRSALYRAVAVAGSHGLRHDELVQKVFDELNLPLELYATDPDVKFRALEETKAALRSVLGYRIYRDLERGWRVTAPNLEQCGILQIEYLSLDELCSAEEIWQGCHAALLEATPETRQRIAKVLLDHMRHELAIKVDALEANAQERIRERSSGRLKSPWALDENEELLTAQFVYPCSRPQGNRRKTEGAHYLSPRGRFGLYLRRVGTFPGRTERFTLEESGEIIGQLLEALRKGGLVEVVRESRAPEHVPAYQVPSAALVWLPGDGSGSFHDPIRMPHLGEEGGRPNPFFVEFYQEIAREAVGLEAREHTAQVMPADRIRREERFKRGDLAVMYSSATMELGVDIASLNVVNMRNVPPTPANYAQRSGRAGRSGQPALVFSYCHNFRSHDQYFFKHPLLMVSGAVAPPRLDLANEDLIRSHLHAIWLAETGALLGATLGNVLDLSGDPPALDLLPSIRDQLANSLAADRAVDSAERIMESIRGELEQADWYAEGWCREVIAQALRNFDQVCDRWRELYRAALQQREYHHGVIGDATRSRQERAHSSRLRREAEFQLDLLTHADNVMEADFYVYRYLASEGFLPGYNFPRLPLSAYVPGSRRGEGEGYISRPRFLAISEFGPRSFLYHEGSRYLIERVILPISPGTHDLSTQSAKICPGCGYLHPIAQGQGVDLCERCGEVLEAPYTNLFRLQNVSTRRMDRIISDEEERVRYGYEIHTAVRFGAVGGEPVIRQADVLEGGEPVARVHYGHSATLWRINMGWKRRSSRAQVGFVLDVERGYWAKNDQDPEDHQVLSPRTERVIPFVEDRRNCLIYEPLTDRTPEFMASLQAALKSAIQIEFQLEETELAAEPLPSREDRRQLLFFEAAEGGAGVLRRLVDDRAALGNVARRALELCHFDPASGEDKRRSERAREDCEAACYDCLMSYTNQGDHRILDRQLLRDYLLRLAGAEVRVSPGRGPRPDRLEELRRQCDSELERNWLGFLEEHSLKLPTSAQKLFQDCSTRPDFIYEEHQSVIYIDGPPHDYPERAERDKAQTACMEDLGYRVIRFANRDDWEAVIRRYPAVFGRL